MEAVQINGTLTTNDGEIAVKWALEGHGILMRAECDIRQYLADGSLVLVLPYMTLRRRYFRGLFGTTSDV